MDRIVEERRVGDHDVAIVEVLADEGTGYVLLMDGVLAGEDEPLDHVPSDEEIRVLLRVHGFR